MSKFDGGPRILGVDVHLHVYFHTGAENWVQRGIEGRGTGGFSRDFEKKVHTHTQARPDYAHAGAHTTAIALIRMERGQTHQDVQIFSYFGLQVVPSTIFGKNVDPVVSWYVTSTNSTVELVLPIPLEIATRRTHFKKKKGVKEREKPLDTRYIAT